MRQFTTIAINAFMELVRQPVFLLLMTAASIFSIFLSVVPYFALGDDPKLVKDSVLAVMFVTGLFASVTSASASVAHEIRSGTALAVLSKPVGRAQFILAKYAGLAAALTLLTYVNLLSCLLASRMAYDAYGDPDLKNAGIYVGSFLLAYGIAGFINYFLRRPFVANAVLAVVVLATIAFAIIVMFIHDRDNFGTPKLVDWRMVQVGILILFALFLLAGVALVCSTRFDMIPTLAICSGVFLLGLMSDYFFGRRAEPAWVTFSTKEELTGKRWSDDQTKLLRTTVEKYDADKNGRLDAGELHKMDATDVARLEAAGLGGSWWASVAYTVVPNWQLFWLADTLETDKPGVPWSYVGKAFAYVLGYLGAALAMALLLFEERELN